MTPKRVLIVDDEPDVARYAEVCLQNDGYETEVVWSAMEALARYSPGRYDLILTDHRMPGMTGLEMASEIRRQQPDQLMILVSGCPPNLPAAVFDGVLEKPLELSALREAVGVLSERKSPVGSTEGE